MIEIDIKQLQTDRRFSDSGLNNFYLFLYLPFGLVVLLFRIILGIVILFLGTILPDLSFTRSLLALLLRAFFGIVVHTNNAANKKNASILISNSISPLDHYIVHLVTDCVMPFQSNLPKQILFSLGLKNFESSTNLEDLKKSIGTHISNSTTSVLIQPENRITNGKAILKFKEWPFSLIDEIQPICLRIRRPIFDISITTITSSYCNDIFWYLFLPWTVYNVTFLPIASKEGLDEVEFAEKVRQDIASELKVEASSYSVADVIEWEKRYLLEQRRARMVHGPATTPLASNNPELHRMARQVKEVLPAVPYNVIYKDLVRTKNVDITISNILEGHVPYTPEQIATSSTVPVTPSVSTTVASTSARESGKDTLCTAASTFPKSAQERMQSFQERKLQLLANARKRYMDKHGLNALASNNC